MALLTQCIPDLRRICGELEGLVQKVVAHRRKIQFAISQLRKFVETFAGNVTPTAMSHAQIESMREVIMITQEYRRIIGENIIQTWAHSALENHSNSVATDLCDFTTRLQQHAANLDKNGAEAFDPASDQWLALHLLDLRAIATSFKDFTKKKGSTSSETMKLIEEKIKSIDVFVKQYEGETIAPGARIFSPIPVNYQTWRLTSSDFKEIDEIGKGASATVYYGRMTATNEEVAIKRLKFKKLTGQKLSTFQRELAILATAEHPAILKFMGATDTHPFSIVTEWMPNKSLYHELRKGHKMTPTLKTIACFDIARGMQFLHSREIIHRDLKSLNVLLDKDLHTRICDFGFSRVQGKEEVMTKNVGTPHWMAPELLMATGGYDNKVDVYAYGILVWEILTGNLPYDGLSQPQIIAEVLVNDARPPIPPGVPEPLERLIRDSWAKDPDARPSFAEITKRFKSGTIFFDKADRDAVMQYIAEVDPSSEDKQNKAIDNLVKQWLDDFTNIEKGEALLNQIAEGGVPGNQAVVEKCWNAIQKVDKEAHTAFFCRACCTFLTSIISAQAAHALRSLPIGSVPRDVVMQVIEMVPTGSTDVDNDLVVIACKNDCHAQAAIHALQPLQVKLALEVCAQKGAPADYIDIVADRCSKYLSNDDPMLVVAAMRCLITLKKAPKIGIGTVRMNMLSRNDTLRVASHVAAAEMAMSGVSLPIDLVDAVASRWSDPIAATVVVCACKSYDVARYIINRLQYDHLPSEKIILQILKMASTHEKLISDVQTLVKKLSAADTNLADVLNRASAALFV